MLFSLMSTVFSDDDNNYAADVGDNNMYKTAGCFVYEQHYADFNNILNDNNINNAYGFFFACFTHNHHLHYKLLFPVAVVYYSTPAGIFLLKTWYDTADAAFAVIVRPPAPHISIHSTCILL